MTKHLTIFFLSLIIVAGLLLTTVTYQVAYDEIGLVKRFGAITKVVDGRAEAGLHGKWPWPVERLVRYPASVQTLETATREMPLADKTQVLLTLYCAWRVDDAALFNRTVETIGGGEDRLRDELRKLQGDALGKVEMSDLVNTDPAKGKLSEIETEIARAAAAKIRADYGMELVRLGVKGLGLPENVTAEVIKAQIQEREKTIKTLEYEGRATAQAIRDRAESARQVILAFAERKARLIEAEGMIAAATWYAKFTDAPELSIFLRYLDSLKIALASRTEFLLDGTEIPAVKWFRTGPTTIDLPAPVNTVSPTTRPAGTPTR